jgi:hypothetical protein
MRPDNGARIVHVDGRGFGHGIGMSQYGAYGKALKGMKAPGILAAYYPGTKVVGTPADQQPGTVRVVLEQGRPEVRFTASGTFRLYDEKGGLVAAVASGQWRALPAPKGGLRLVPPPGQTDVPRIEGVRIEPASPQPGQDITIAFRTTVPAYVRAVARAPGGADVEVLPSQAVGTDEVVAKLAPSTKPGAYVVSLGVDAGGGRTASQVLMPVVVAPPDPAAPPKVWTPDGPKVMGSAAAAKAKTDQVHGMSAAAATKRVVHAARPQALAALQSDDGLPGWMLPAAAIGLGALGGSWYRARRKRGKRRHLEVVR